MITSAQGSTCFSFKMRLSDPEMPRRATSTKHVRCQTVAVDAEIIDRASNLMAQRTERDLKNWLVMGVVSTVANQCGQGTTRSAKMSDPVMPDRNRDTTQCRAPTLKDVLH